MASAAGGRITAGAGASLVGSGQRDRVPEATCYLGNLEPRVTEEIVWELFMQCGPVVSVYLPKDRVTNEHQGYGFVEFKSEQDADYVSLLSGSRHTSDPPPRVPHVRKVVGKSSFESVCVEGKGWFPKTKGGCDEQYPRF